MVKNQTLVILGVALVVAVIASIISASITGNVIKVKKNPTGIDIYTKAEVDSKLNSLNKGIKELSTMISKCNCVVNNTTGYTSNITGNQTSGGGGGNWTGNTTNSSA